MKMDKTQWHRVDDSLTGAMYWHGFGFDVIPILQGKKIPAVKWGPWLDNLDPQKVHEHWAKNPDHELGFIVGDDMIIFDADSTEAVFALVRLEARFGVMPKMVVNTTKGQHHYFRCLPGTIAKSDAHDSEKYPDRIDIKTGRNLVILPISTGKTLRILEVETKGKLSIAPQEFINAIYEHNGRTAPSQPVEMKSYTQDETDGISLQRLDALLDKIEPDCGYEDWLHVGMSIFHETDGNDEGRALFDRWSSKGKKYKGVKDIESKWRSFRLDTPNPVTIRTLNKMAYDAEDFEVCEVVNPAVEPVLKTVDVSNPLAKYFLCDINDLEKQAVEQVQILGNIVLLGQATVIYAKQNTGKTLITLFLIIEGIKSGKFDPAKLIYINMNDDSTGLATKARLAEEYGFRMVADGHQGFEAKKFRMAMEEMISSDSAHGYIVILDTLKKFVNIMDKGKSSNFAKVVRQFVLKGGTVVALSHANKNPDGAGKTVYGGTTDIIDDFDCGHILTTVSEDPDNGLKVVEFENIKRRGNVALSVSYSYALAPDISYHELLMSVEEVDDMQLLLQKQKIEMLSDAEVIAVIEGCIKEGVNTKMRLADATAERANISRKSTIRIIEKYTGPDPDIHRWSFKVRDRGAKVYALLKQLSDGPPDPTIDGP